jgi:hypothetical protein
MDHLKFRYFVQKLQFVTAMINSVEQLTLRMYRLKLSYYFHFLFLAIEYKDVHIQAVIWIFSLFHILCKNAF